MMANDIKMDIWMFRPPVLVGERVVWLGSGSGLPQGGVVRWIGKLPEMGPDWTVGLELDKPLPFGGIDGTWGNRHLFTCQPKHGLIVPIAKTIRESDISWWPKDIAGKSLQHDKGSAELTPVVQPPPTFPRSKGVTKVTAPVRPFRRASPEDKTPVIQIPQSVATGEKGLSADKAEVKLIQAIESSHGKVSKGSPRPSSSSGITSPELSSTRDARGSSIQSSRVSESSSCSMASASSGDNSEVEKLTAQLTLPKGLADFKANLEAEQKVEHNMNTLAINRLLRRLEAAIAGGQHMLAAGLAKDLARLKISCSVTRHRRSLDTSPASITVDMYVEDKVSHQGPIPLQVTPVLTVAQLKDKVEQEFEIPAGVQRWILGKLLASDDSKTLADHSISSGGCPIFLYLVAPDGDHEGEVTTAADPHPDPGSVTKQELVSKVESKDTPPGAKPGGGWYYNDDDERYSFCEDTESELSEGEDIPQPAKQNPIIPGTATVAQLQQVTKVIKGQKEEEDSEELDDEDEEDSIEEETIPVVVVNDKPKVLVGPLSPTVPKFPLPGPSRQLSLVEQPDKPATSQTSMKSPTPATSQTAVVLKPVTNMSPKPFHPARREAKVEKQSAVAQAPVDKHLAQPAKPAAPPEQPTGTLKLGWKCPVCTLVNSPTRPGCAACTTERPLKYVVPVEYRANDQELQRMQQEQQFDNELKQAEVEEKNQGAQDNHQHYQQLVNLDNTDLVPNVEPFDCPVCLVPYEGREGVVLRDCLHTFCRMCLANTVAFNEEAEVKCPYRDADYACDSVLQEREIKALVAPAVYEQHLAKSVAQAENKIGNTFHCKTADCKGWCIFEDNVNEFRCPVCRRFNCLTCQAIHEGLNCRQYQEQVKQESETNADARRTKEMLEEMVDRGEAMACPTCQVVLMKKWGCDWLRCSMCKTEICWVTRGPRWGPGGKGDTTGGCQCGVNGVKCHPRCNYCH